MPNPISKVAPNANIWLGNAGASSISERPELAVLAMQAIESAANVEGFMLRLFVQLLGGDKSLAATVYLALEAAGPKAAAIAAAAKHVLTEPEFSVLDAILRIDKSNRKPRNDIVHHTWGHSPQLSDALLLVDPRATVDQVPQKTDIYVWTKQDFKALIDANNSLCRLASLFEKFLAQRGLPASNLLFEMLLTEPDIQARVAPRA